MIDAAKKVLYLTSTELGIHVAKGRFISEPRVLTLEPLTRCFSSLEDLHTHAEKTRNPHHAFTLRSIQTASLLPAVERGGTNPHQAPKVFLRNGH
jgi:hypothetical protein